MKLPTSRLLPAVQFARPLAAVLPDVLAWASSTGRSVYTAQQLRELHAEVKQQADRTSPEVKHFEQDLFLAVGGLKALEIHPDPAWETYLDFWQTRRLQHRLEDGSPLSARLRDFHDRFGGLLFNNLTLPLGLLIPQPSGLWVHVGYDLLAEVIGDPFGPDRDNLPIARLWAQPSISVAGLEVAA